MIVKMNDDLFLKTARKIAKYRDFNPDKLDLATDGIHKLEYRVDGKIIKFGRAGYFDFPTYLYNACIGNMTIQEAFKKRFNYRQRARAVRDKMNNKFSKSNLAWEILW